MFLDEGGDLGGDAAEGLRFIDEAGLIGLFDGLDDGVLVERADGAEVDDFRADVVLFL